MLSVLVQELAVISFYARSYGAHDAKVDYRPELFADPPGRSPLRQRPARPAF